ncbi:hypothetical protein MMC13_002759 [Lambiella insularis]|nr:hypothetical protein [Lambiella insularis]
MSLPERHEKEFEVQIMESTDTKQDTAYTPMISSDLETLHRGHANKRHVRALRFSSRLLSVILSSYMVASMACTLTKYYTTRNKDVSGNGGHPWPSNTTLWPTFMVLAFAVVSMVMDLITLCSYCCGGAIAANRSGQVMGYIGYAVLVVHAIVWIVTTGLFKMASNAGNDLYGFSCSAKADMLESQVESYLDFDSLCMVQTDTWITLIIEAISFVVTLIIFIIIARRAMSKRRLKTYEQRMSA